MNAFSRNTPGSFFDASTAAVAGRLFPRKT
jgi:hypothetical protein